MNWKFSLLIICTFFITTDIFSQNDWALKSEKEGIQIYTKNLESSPFKAIRTVFTINTTLTKLTAVLLDIPNSIDWVYATKKVYTLKQVSASELIYYSEVTIPWPVSNRDFICRLTVHQDPATKVVTVDGENKPAYTAENKGIVRIQKCFSRWVITPLTNGQVKVDYVLQVDPGGSVPAWLINLFATKGPFESFKNLRLQVKKPLYNSASLPFIKD